MELFITKKLQTMSPKMACIRFPMARRLGLHYQRLDVGGEDSYSHGVRVPVEELLKITNELVEAMKKKPSCVLASVINDPYFDSVAVPKNILDVN
jgi:hypothetical protein